MSSRTRDVLLNFKPVVDQNSTQADKELAALVKKGVDAQLSQNKKAIQEVETELKKLYGMKGDAEVDVNVRVVGDGLGRVKLLEQYSGKLFSKISKELVKSEKYSDGFTGELKRGMKEVGDYAEILEHQIEDVNAKLAESMKKRAQLKEAGAIGGRQIGRADAAIDINQGQLDSLNAKLKATNDQQLEIIRDFARFAPPAAVSAKLAEINQKIAETDKRTGKVGKGWTSVKGKIAGAFSGLKGGNYDQFFSGLQGGFKDTFTQITQGGGKANKSLAMLNKQKAILASGGSRIAQLGQNMAAIGMATQSMLAPFLAVVAVLTAVLGVINMIANRQKALQGLKLTLDGVGVSIANQEKVLAKSRNIALSYGVSLAKVEGAFKRLTPAILEAGGSLDDASTAIEGIAARTTMLGLNTEQSGRYIEAFAQVMGKGKLQSEELNQQFSELDGGLRGQLQNWLAVNKGIEDFEGAMKKGEITSAMFLEAFKGINKEILQKFKKNIDSVQTSLNSLGKEGGMTLAQFQAKMQALSSIGLDNVGKALGPLGKELAKIYAAFVQIFTKIATEMPGIQKAFQFVGDLVGRVLKVGINAILGLFYEFARLLDFVFTKLGQFINLVMKIPVIGDAFRAIGNSLNWLNKSFDKQIDASAKLSDATKGVGIKFNSLEQDLMDAEKELANLKSQGKESTPEFKKLADEIERLQRLIGEKGTKELNRKIKEQKLLLESRRDVLKEDLNAAQKEVDAQKEKVELIKKGLNWQLDAQEKVVNETIEGIEKEKEAYEASVKAKLSALKEEGEAKARMFRDAKKALDLEARQSARTYEDRKKSMERAFEAEEIKLKKIKKDTEEKYDAELEEISSVKDAVEKRYDAEESRLEAAKERIEEKADAEINAIERSKEAAEKAFDARQASIDGETEMVQSVYDAEIEGINQAKEQAEAAHNAYMDNLERQEDRVTATHEKNVAGIEKAKEKSASAHSARIAELDSQLANAKKVTDEVLDRIQAEKAASQAATDIKIASLEELTPAEKALAEMERIKLRMKANDMTASQEERLEAKARLERMERQEQIAKLQSEEKERQAELDKKAAEAAEKQAQMEMKLAEEKKRLSEEEEARQSRMAEQVRQLNAEKETSLKALADLEAKAEKDQKVRLANLEAMQKTAEANREASLEAVSQKQEQLDADKELALAAFDEKAATVEANREAAIDAIEEKESTLQGKREKHLESLEEKEKEIQEEKKNRLQEIEDQEATLQENKKTRLRELEDMREQQKRNEENRKTALETAEQKFQDKLKQNIKDIEEARDAQLEAYEERIDKQKLLLDEITKKREEIDKAIEQNEMSEEDFQLALSATHDMLSDNLEVLKDMTTEAKNLATELDNIETDLQNLPSGSATSAVSTSSDSDSPDIGGTNTEAPDSDFFGDSVKWSPDSDVEVGSLNGDVQRAEFNGDAEVSIDGVENPWEVQNAEIREADITWVDADTGMTMSAPTEWGMFAGGKIGAGQRTVVNEFGKEGFIDARTGRMKQINAPAFGKWTAPSSGTVIPAHIWKSIKGNKSGQWQESRIAQGIEVDTSSVASNGNGVSSLGSSVMAAMAAASSGGDQFNNNITIQSTNPTKSAGDMMVSMARMRLRR